MFLLGFALLLVYTNWFWRWDQLLYDEYLRLLPRAPLDDIIIVAIDEQSLAQFGRWPWSRRIHGELVNKLTEAGAKAIALDILFAEPNVNDPEGDAILAQAIRNSGRVVLPVLAEQIHQGSQLVETLPMPELTEAAAMLGHVDVELDWDGIARSVYLKSGLGQPYWPSLSLAMLLLVNPEGSELIPERLPGQRNIEPYPQSLQLWVRDYQILIPFAGPPGHFRHISYVDALNDTRLSTQFRDKFILVGATATGLGDVLPTPVSGLGYAMPGVELQANVLDTLRRGLAIIPMALGWRMLLTGTIVLLSLLSYAYAKPRRTLLAAVLLLLLTATSSIGLLHYAHLWFPPVVSLLSLISGYLLWSLQTSHIKLRKANDELEYRVQARTAELSRANFRLEEEISERKQAEMALRDSESRLRTILNTVIDGIITVDEQGVIKSANWAMAHIFNYSVNELLEHRFHHLFSDPYRSQYAQFFSNLPDSEDAITQELIGLRHDGSSFPMEFSASRVKLDNSRWFTCIVRDITERKRMERMKNEFISMVSHELRTPLTSIRGSLGLVAGGVAGQLPDKARTLVDVAHNNSQRLVLLVNDILDIQKIESGRMEFKLRALTLMKLVEQAIEANRGYGAQLDVSFHILKQLPHARVSADSDRLMQVMANLLSNAAKFSPRGGIVEVSVEYHNHRLRVSVTDHGPGIPEEFRPRIFQKFAQADTSDARNKTGTGLGLNITKAIVEQHGGNIGFNTETGVGTTFYFELPEYQQQSSVAQSPQSAIS